MTMPSMNPTDLAATFGDKPAIVMVEDGATLTYRELESASNRIAHLFRHRGLRAGDHIAILTENCLDVFPVVWAAQRTGLLYTPVNWHLSDDEAAYVVENCGARVLVHSERLDRLGAVVVDGNPVLEARFTTGDSSPSGAEILADAVATLPGTPVDDELEGYYMLYSSGTTGRPKGILPALTGAPFGTGLAIDSTMRDAFGFGPHSVYLSPGPLYHAAPLGWTMGTVRNGGTALVMETFDAERTLDAIERYGVTHAQFVPTMFVRMLELPESARTRYDVSSLRVVVHAAAPCPVEVEERMIEWFGPKILEFYAGSEGNGFFMITHRNGSNIAVPSADRPWGRCTSATSPAANSAPARSARCGSATAWTSSTTAIRRRPPPPTTTRAGRPSAISGTSTRTATCTSRRGAPI